MAACGAGSLASPSPGQAAEPWGCRPVIQRRFSEPLGFKHSRELRRALRSQPQQAGSPGHGPPTELHPRGSGDREKSAAGSAGRTSGPESGLRAGRWGPGLPTEHPAALGSCGRQTFSQAVGELPFVMSASFVLHEAVSLRLSQDKLSRVGVPWGRRGEGRSGLELLLCPSQAPPSPDQRGQQRGHFRTRGRVSPSPAHCGEREKLGFGGLGPAGLWLCGCRSPLRHPGAQGQRPLWVTTCGAGLPSTGEPPPRLPEKVWEGLPRP